MENTILPIESIQERDIDLILLEELSTDNSFCEWFVQELNLPNFTQANGAWRSISAFGLGETDILFSYNSNEKRIFVLIENKLDATFQLDQFYRYEKRAKLYIDKSRCDEAFCILTAPNLYCENQNYFDNYISYETIGKRLLFTGTKRNIFKNELLNIAVEKLRRGYQPINSEIVQKFWKSYWNYKELKHPSLSMKQPGIVPHNSDWPILYDDKLKDVIFYHKLGQGNIDASFRGFSEKIEFKIREILPENTTLIKHSKSFSLRIFSGKIDRTREFDTQIIEVENGLNNIELIRNWLFENKNYWT
jgi:hypothetical protein